MARGACGMAYWGWASRVFRTHQDGWHTMATEIIAQVELEVAEFLACQPSPEEIIAFRPSAALVERFDSLIEKERASNITDDELDELERYMHVEHMMRLIKAAARRRLGQTTPQAAGE